MRISVFKVGHVVFGQVAFGLLASGGVLVQAVSIHETPVVKSCLVFSPVDCV